MKSKNVAGFTAVEVMVAVFILSFVGLLIGQTLLKTGQSANKNREGQKASALAEMVLQQYAAYAAHRTGDLASYNEINVSPQTFFKTKDSLGYEDMRITTRSEKQTSGGSLVTVTIAWGAGTQTGMLNFSKTFAETSGGTSDQVLSGI